MSEKYPHAEPPADSPVQFFINRFLFGYCAHPILVVIPLALLGLVLGFGEGLGVTDLIYHEDSWQQAFGGVVLAFVFVACGYAGFLFDARRYPLRPQSGHWFDVPHWGFWAYFAGIAASAATVFVAGAALYSLVGLYLIWRNSISGFHELWNPLELLDEAERAHWPFFVGLLMGFCSALLVGTLSYGVWARLSPRLLRPRAVRRPKTPPVDLPQQPGTKPGEPRPGPVVRWLRRLRPLWLGGDAPYPSWWLAGWLLGVLLPIHLLMCWLTAWAEEMLAWQGAAATAILLALACWCRHRQLGGLLQGARNVGSTGEETGLDVYHYRGAGVLFVMLSVSMFLVTDGAIFGGTLGQPTAVPLFGAALFVAVALYALVALAYNRALPIIALGAGALLVFAGIPPYKFRFPGLESRYRAGVLPRDITSPRFPFVPDDGGRRGNVGVLHLRNQAVWEAKWRENDTLALEKLESLKLNPAEHPDRFREFRERDYRLLAGPEPKFLTGQDPRAPLVRAEWRRGEHLVRTSDLRPGLSGTAKKPLIIISVSGGGHAAAVWTLGVLNRLEHEFAQKGHDFPAHVLFITGASGGMMGAAYYTMSLPDRAATEARTAFLKTAQCESQSPAQHQYPGRSGSAVYQLARDDFLKPLVNRMLFNDIPAHFSPFPNLHDRGRRLEEEWEEWVVKRGGLKLEFGKSPFEFTFEDLKPREQSGQYPFLVFAPMMVEDGRRLLISNLDLSSAVSNDGNGLDRTTVVAQNQNYNFSCSGLELFRAFREQHSTFKLSTAVRMSASFPFFSPAVSLPTEPRRRVVDAGYYDNYGVCAAASWLFSTDSQEWLDAHVSKVAVIQIRASNTEKSRRLEEVPDESGNLLSRSVEELISPLEGLNQARVGSSSFRNDGQLELLSKWFREKKDGGDRYDHRDRFFTTVAFELGDEVALSWYLGKKNRDAIHKALTAERGAGNAPNNLGDKIMYLLEWFERPHRSELPVPWKP